MKNIFNILVIAIMFSACSQEPAENMSVVPEKKPKTQDNALQGYQDKIQRARDMEQEVLKQAEKQKKAIDDASGN